MSERVLSRLAAELNAEISPDDPRRFDLAFESPGVLARVELAPDDRTLVTDVYVYDTARFHGGVRRNLVRSLLTINDAAVRNSNYFVSLDTRSYLVLTGRLSIEDGALDGELFNAHLTQWLEQAVRLRDFAQSLAFEAGDFQYDLEPLEVEA